jgi:hypothetical protein
MQQYFFRFTLSLSDVFPHWIKVLSCITRRLQPHKMECPNNLTRHCHARTPSVPQIIHPYVMYTEGQKTACPAISYHIGRSWPYCYRVVFGVRRPIYIQTVHLMSVWPCIASTTIQATNKMQQFRFIDPFQSALHVLGANYAHPQEHFDCIYSFWYDTKCSWGRA